MKFRDLNDKRIGNGRILIVDWGCGKLKVKVLRKRDKTYWIALVLKHINYLGSREEGSECIIREDNLL